MTTRNTDISADRPERISDTGRPTSRQFAVAVIVAAGSGSRFGADRPKQFCDLGGRPLLMTTIEAFTHSGLVDRVIIVLSPDMTGYWAQLCAEHKFTSPEIVTGGATRALSVKNAIASLDTLPGDTVVMIHDGARPFPTPGMIAEASRLDNDADISIPVVKVTDSLRVVDPQGGSRSIDRSLYRAVQTPQAARLSDLATAYSSPDIDSFTDDASALEAAGMTRVKLVEGSYRNIKITNPGDLAVAEAMLDK